MITFPLICIGIGSLAVCALALALEYTDVTYKSEQEFAWHSDMSQFDI